MKKLLEIFLGFLTAMGGFVDIGDLVANALAGARFGLALAWVVPVGVLGIVVYAEMAGRVASVSGRPVFDLVRERLGARVALANLVASFLVNFLTLTAEIGGVAIVLQLVTDVSYLLWLPLVAAVVWLVIWRVPFQHMERLFGLLGLALCVFVVALWRLHPDWHALTHAATHPVRPVGEGRPTYLYYAIALFGAAMTPYEVFFYSSGAVEERWGPSDLAVNRANVYIGFPLGGLLSLAIMGSAAVLLGPRGIEVAHLGQVGLPVVVALGKAGLAVLLVGLFAAIFAAALETALSSGYTVAQFFGWQWGKYVTPAQAPRFHLVVLLSIIAAAMLGLTSVDPIKVTEYSIVLSAAALPLTYLPILVVANDPDYMGDKVNSRRLNLLAGGYLLLIGAVSIVTIPLLLATKAGQ